MWTFANIPRIIGTGSPGLTLQEKELSLWRRTFTFRTNFGNVRLMAALTITFRAENSPNTPRWSKLA
jgi:hypothetical protein